MIIQAPTRTTQRALSAGLHKATSRRGGPQANISERKWHIVMKIIAFYGCATIRPTINNGGQFMRLPLKGVREPSDISAVTQRQARKVKLVDIKRLEDGHALQGRY